MTQGAMTVAERLALRRGEIAQNKSKGLRPFKLPAGKTLFRILPQPGYPNNNATGTLGIERRFGMTYLKSFDNKNVGSIGDRDVTYGQNDPIRDMIFEAMRQAPSDDVKKHYRDMLASPRIVFCALILSHPQLQSPTEPVLIEISETAFDEGILAQADVWAATGVDVFDPAEGHVFQVEKSGTGMETSYTWAVTPSKAPVGQAVLDKVIDLDSWVTSLFEGKEARVLEALGKLNASAGLTIAPPQTVPQITGPSAAHAPATTGAASVGQTTTVTPHAQPAMVTHAIEEVEAEYTPVVESPPATVAAAPVAATPAVSATTVAATPAAPDAEPDLASILASLN